MKRIITISREFGSAGRSIGRMTAEKLGIHCYDQELIERIAEESGFAKEYVKESGEFAASSSWFSNALAARDSYGRTSQDKLFFVQSSVIRDLGEKEDCVIIGRCADYILRDRADLLTVFIHADMAFRTERIVRIYGASEDSPDKRLREKDKRRAAYYQIYTDMKWGNLQNYHVALDSGKLGIEKCVKILTELY